MDEKNQDQAQDQAKSDAKKQEQDKIVSAGKALAAQGFGKEQIAQQLSSKHQKTVAEISALLDQNKEDKS